MAKHITSEPKNAKAKPAGKSPAAGPKDRLATPSGLPLETVVTAKDLGAWDWLRELGFPGQYPFARGVYPTMYRGRLWTMRQYAGFGAAVESNQRYRYLLSQGQTGLSVAFDLPTQHGLDSDHPLAVGEVGKVGVAIDSLRTCRRCSTASRSSKSPPR
jgi:methylmalonyl-CoA mutase N-terminal domain/subunit